MKRRLLIMFLLGCLLPFAVQAQHGTFRFAQITDIHFSPNNPNPTEDLLRSVAQINATDSIDFVLVTGDITEEGDRATMLKVKETLDLLKAKYYVILGNHETKWSDIVDVEPDEEGCVEVDLGQIVDYIIKEAHKDEMGDYDPEEILFVVQGELEYTESLDDDEE